MNWTYLWYLLALFTGGILIGGLVGWLRQRGKDRGGRGGRGGGR